MNGKFKILILILTCIAFSSCSEVNSSASQALDEANSVVKTSREVAWGEKTPTPEDVEEAKRQEELRQQQNPNRY